MAHVKTHHAKKEKQNMTKIERFITEGNEKADRLAKARAMLDEGFTAEARSETMKQEREEVYVAFQYAASFHCLVERNGKIVRNSGQSRKNVDFCRHEKWENEASNRVVRGSEQVPMCEVRKRKQIHENAR